MSYSFNDRVSSLSAFSTNAKLDKASYERDFTFKSGSDFLNPKASVLGLADDQQDVSKWDSNVTRLYESRTRPFWSVAATTYGASAGFVLISTVLLYAFHRQNVLVDSLGIATITQTAVTMSGSYCAGFAMTFVLLHALAVYRLGSDLGSSYRTGGSARPSSIRFVCLTDFMLKVSFILTLTTAAITLRYWDNEPSISRSPTIWDNFDVPRRSWVLGLIAAQAAVTVGLMVVGASLPYRPSYQIFSSSLRTFGLFAFLSSFGAAILAMVTVVKAPATFFGDLSIWGPLALDLIAGLGAVALAGSAHAARNTRELGAGGSWITILASLTSAVILGAILTYTDAVPELDLPLVISNSLFASAICAFVAASQLALAAIHLATWKFVESMEPTRPADFGRDFDL